MRVTSIVDLSEATSPIHAKRVLLAPVSGLPLSSADAIHRLKLLAGPRWSPGRPGAMEFRIEGNDGYNGGDRELGREGWVKISEERFKNPSMNRKSASDMLERLVEAANVSGPYAARRKLLIRDRTRHHLFPRISPLTCAISLRVNGNIVIGRV